MQLTFQSPLGPLTVTANESAITALSFADLGGSDRAPLLLRAADQLSLYFDRRLQDFDLPLAPAGGAFERQIWRALVRIPYGATVTYGQLARPLGAVPRAVGQACGANPIPIVVPCHRVLSAAGSGGFSAPGGLETKYALLRLEGAALL